MANVFDPGGGDCFSRTQRNPWKRLIRRHLVVEAAGVESLIGAFGQLTDSARLLVLTADTTAIAAARRFH
jgi:hypothetical protein